jgi:Electron transfer DM13
MISFAFKIQSKNAIILFLTKSVRRGIKIGTISAIVIIVGVGAYYLASPLFISTEVNEPLPTSAVRSESFQRFAAMNEEEKMQAAKQMSPQERDEIMSAAARVNNSVDESMNRTLLQQPQNTTSTANTRQDTVRTGSFIGVGDGIHNAEGIAKVIPLEDGSNILRLENLQVTNGPDLYVYLATDKSALDFVSLGKLKANNGNQNYNIPSQTDLIKYDTVLIWCRPFSVLFGSAELALAS